MGFDRERGCHGNQESSMNGHLSHDDLRRPGEEIARENEERKLFIKGFGPETRVTD